MPLLPGSISPAPSNASVPSLRRASISSARSTPLPRTPKPRPLSLHPRKGDMSHTSSRTWLSTHTVEKEKWHKTVGRLHLFKLNQPETTSFLPWDWNQWIDHRLAVKAFEKRVAERDLRKRSERAKNKRNPCTAPFRGKIPHDDRGAVLANQTVWCVRSNTRYGGSIWPTEEEALYEGDSRINGDRKAFRRCLPLVKEWEPGNQAGKRAAARALEPYEFDKMQKPPRREDIYVEPYSFTVEELPQFLNGDILAALDEIDFS